MNRKYIPTTQKRELSTTIDYDLFEKLLKATRKHKISQSAIIERALDRYLEKLEKEGEYEGAPKKEFTTQA